LWLREIGEQLHKKLARANFVAERGSALLQDFVDEHTARGITSPRKDASPGKTRKWNAAARHLRIFFKQQSMRSVTLSRFVDGSLHSESRAPAIRLPKTLSAA
jgi:hypothetical protein